MTDENYTFTQARTRLEEIVSQVRSKDVSLEKSLDLLEEGVRLANICTEQSDHTEWRSVIGDEDGEEATAAAEASSENEDGAPEPADQDAGSAAAEADGEPGEQPQAGEAAPGEGSEEPSASSADESVSAHEETEEESGDGDVPADEA
jgi:exodeoxyribonuclease VII small subunit